MDRMKQAQGLLTHYDKCWRAVYNKELKYNRYTAKWAAADVIDSVGYERAKELIEYYFKVTKPLHPLTWFFYNFDKLDQMETATQKDSKERAALRAQTKERVENEYRDSSDKRDLQE